MIELGLKWGLLRSLELPRPIKNIRQAMTLKENIVGMIVALNPTKKAGRK
jgi:hypothetical protein